MQFDEKTAEAKYYDLLKEIDRKVGIGNETTYLSELDKAGRKLLGVKFKGVFPSDKIPKLNDLKPYCILNLDRSDQSGSHWVGLAKYGDNALLYDSFGRKYNEIIPNIRFSGNGKIVMTDDDAEQGPLQENCGLRSLGFLVFCERYGCKNALLI